MKTDLTVGAYIIHENKVLLIHHKKLGLWLPVGGHLENDETPDDAVLREVREEVGLDVELLNKSPVPGKGNIKRNTAVPFYTNVHSVGDHDHYCLFYLCRALNPEKLKINKELRGFGWFSAKDLYQEHIPEDVRNIALFAFKKI